MKQTLLVVLAIALCLQAAGCSSDEAGSDQGPWPAVTVAPSATTLNEVGETAQLAARVADDQGDAPASQPAFSWSSSDTSVATVSDSGLVTAAGSGSATITASSDRALGTATVVVVIPAARLLRTGQTATYAPGDDGDLQKGVVWPEPRFTDNGDQTVTDNLTGLAWATSALGPCGGYANLTWQEALDYVACLNETDYLGHGDWRLPNVNEVASTRNYGEADPFAWLWDQGFPMVPTSPWASTPFASSQGLAWVLDDQGLSFNARPLNHAWPVRGESDRLPATGLQTCVRTEGALVEGAAIACAGTGQDGEFRKGVSLPDPRFREDLGGTMTDLLTGLVWTKDANSPGPENCEPGTPKDWRDALYYVECLNAAQYLGFSDWRLPNVNELRSLVSYASGSPAWWLRIQGFANIRTDDLPGRDPGLSLYFSSTTVRGSFGLAWGVSLDDGSTRKWTGKDFENYVWPVRGGP